MSESAACSLRGGAAGGWDPPGGEARTLANGNLALETIWRSFGAQQIDLPPDQPESAEEIEAISLEHHNAIDLFRQDRLVAAILQAVVDRVPPRDRLSDVECRSSTPITHAYRGVRDSG